MVEERKIPLLRQDGSSLTEPGKADLCSHLEGGSPNIDEVRHKQRCNLGKIPDCVLSPSI